MSNTTVIELPDNELLLQVELSQPIVRPPRRDNLEDHEREDRAYEAVGEMLESFKGINLVIIGPSHLAVLFDGSKTNWSSIRDGMYEDILDEVDWPVLGILHW